MLWLHTQWPCPKPCSSGLSWKEGMLAAPPILSNIWKLVSDFMGCCPLFALNRTIDVPAADLALSIWLLSMLDAAIWVWNEGEEEERRLGDQSELDLTNVRDARKPTVPSMRRKA